VIKYFLGHCIQETTREREEERKGCVTEQMKNRFPCLSTHSSTCLNHVGHYTTAPSSMSLIDTKRILKWKSEFLRE